MGQAPEPRQIKKADLQAILKRARNDTAFRDKVISTPEDVFKDAHLGPQKKDWVGFSKA